MKRAIIHVAWTVAFAVAASTFVVTTAGTAFGHGGVSVDPQTATTGTISEQFKIKTKGESRVFVSHIFVAPGSHTAWHTHPGPHIVLIKGSSLRVYSEGCEAYTDYAPGTGFFADDPDFVHAAKNMTSDTVEIVVTDIREDNQPTTINVAPQPSHECLDSGA